MSQGFTDPTKLVKSQVQRFVRDYKRVFKASKGLVVFLFIGSFFLGLVPFLELGIVAGGVDALIGASGISVKTSDADKYYWYQIALMLTAVPLTVFFRPLSGVVARLARETIEVVFVVSATVLLAPAAPISVLALWGFVGAFFFVKNKWARWSMSSLMLLIVIQPFAEFLQAAILKDSTVGDALWASGLLIMLATWLAVRPYLIRNAD